MKKLVTMLIALALGVGSAQAAGVVAYDGQGFDGSWHNTNNWWRFEDFGLGPKMPTSTDQVFFNGAGGSNPIITITNSVTVNNIVFEKGTVGYTISGSTLTVNENEGLRLIDLRAAITTDQTIASDLVLGTVNDANNVHIFTGNGATGKLILSGNVSQSASSQGVGIFPGTSDVEISGNVDGSGKLWKIRDATGSGVLKLTGAGNWTGNGTVQIDNATGVLLARSTSDSTAFAPGVLQVLDGGTLSLGNDEQIDDSVVVVLGSGTFNLDGNTETIESLEFLVNDDLATLDMGSAGTLNLANQNNAITWGSLLVNHWESGVDHINLVGGSFSSSQLAAITFAGWAPAGAKVEGGELLPTGTSATAYETWASAFGVGAGTNDADGDGLLNVYEYGLGGDPTNAADQGISPVYSTGAGLLTYIYPQLSDPSHGLDYHLELTDNLVLGGWTNTGYTVAGTNVVAGDFDYVTNTVPVDSGQKFIRLFINTL